MGRRGDERGGDRAERGGDERDADGAERGGEERTIAVGPLEPTKLPAVALFIGRGGTGYCTDLSNVKISVLRSINTFVTSSI